MAAEELWELYCSYWTIAASPQANVTYALLVDSLLFVHRCMAQSGHIWGLQGKALCGDEQRAMYFCRSELLLVIIIHRKINYATCNLWCCLTLQDTGRFSLQPCGEGMVSTHGNLKICLIELLSDWLTKMQIPCLAFLSLLVSDGPQPEQIFTVVKISETKIAIKSGYGEYMFFSNRNGYCNR